MSIQIPYRGIIEIVGEHDTGKTIAALQTVYPWKKTVFVDDDVKGEATIRQLENMEEKKRTEIFGSYIDLRAKRAAIQKGRVPPSAQQLLEQVVEPTIDQICKSKWEVIVWDTWRIVYQSARGYVERNQAQFKDTVKWQGSSTIIQGLVSRVARMVEQNYMSKLRDSCELLVVTHHIKDRWVNNVVVGVIPESSQTFDEHCFMRVWLRRNPKSKVPIILFLKRPNIPKAVKGKPRFVNIVPPKITPNAKDESIWDAIERYRIDPVESRELRPDETPTKEELAMISGELTDDQKLYMLEVLKHAESEKETIDGLISASRGKTKGGGSVENGAQLLSKAMSVYNMDAVHVAEVLEIELEDVADLQGEEAENAWETVQEFAKEAGVDPS